MAEAKGLGQVGVKREARQGSHATHPLWSRGCVCCTSGSDDRQRRPWADRHIGCKRHYPPPVNAAALPTPPQGEERVDRRRSDCKRADTRCSGRSLNRTCIFALPPQDLVGSRNRPVPARYSISSETSPGGGGNSRSSAA